MLMNSLSYIIHMQCNLTETRIFLAVLACQFLVSSTCHIQNKWINLPISLASHTLTERGFGYAVTELYWETQLSYGVVKTFLILSALGSKNFYQLIVSKPHLLTFGKAHPLQRGRVWSRCNHCVVAEEPKYLTQQSDNKMLTSTKHVT